jgi:hypothetical protein
MANIPVQTSFQALGTDKSKFLADSTIDASFELGSGPALELRGIRCDGRGLQNSYNDPRERNTTVIQDLTIDEVWGECDPLIEAGAALHWLVPGDKMPLDKQWSELPRYSKAELARRHRANANIGIRLGEPSDFGGLYLHLVDLDVRKAELAPEAWSELLTYWPGARDFPTVISGSGGESRHIYFLSRKPFKKNKLSHSETFSMVFDEKRQREVKKYDWEIDVYGTGSQAVLPPSRHPVTKLPYRWLRPIDFDLLFLMEISASMVENWGVTATNDDDLEDDDLGALIAADPIDLNDGQLEQILADLPENWVEDRDQWWTVGMALHHQFRGTNEGFEIWCYWSKQSAKFDAKDSAAVWKSFKGAKNPIRLPTLIQASNVARMKREMDLEDDDSDHFAPSSGTDLSDLLGTDLPETAQAAQPAQYDPDWEQLLHRTEDGDVKSTLHNIRLIIQNDPRTRGLARMNEFSQRIVFRSEPIKRRRKRDKGRPVVNLEGPLWKVTDPLNGETWTDTHDTSIRAFIEAPTTQGGYAIKVSDRDLIGSIDFDAQQNRFHPVREWILSTTWDGIPRVETLFIDYLGCDNTPYHRQCSILTMLGIVTRIFEPGHKFDFVPILEGVQGKGKSSFISTLGMEWAGELTGDISKPTDMIPLMRGKIILEIGELSAMARHEVNDLKAFVSRPNDEGRLAYERRTTVFPRQCIFMGSTNDREYFRDQTGNRRYWPIECKIEGQIDSKALKAAIDQIYAEAYHLYRALRDKQPFGQLPLFITDEVAKVEALSLQESRRVETAEEALAGQILAWLDNPIGSGDGFEDLGTPAILRHETCMAQIWVECLGRSGSIPTNESAKIGRAMQIIGWRRTAGTVQSYEVNKKYGKCRVYTRL